MKNCKKIGLLMLSVFVLLACGVSASAENATVSAKTRRFESIRTGMNGLTQGLIQDADGFFWLTSYNIGIYQWDGVTLRTYSPANSGLPATTITTIYEERGSGRFWIGTVSDGLVKYEKSTAQFTRYLNDPNDAASLSSNNLGTISHGRVILKDRGGLLWVGTHEGLNAFDEKTGRFIRYFHQPGQAGSLIDDEVNALLEDRAGTLWVGTSGGVCRLEKAREEFICYAHAADEPESLSHNEVNILFEDSRRTLWIGTQDGLNAFEPDSGAFTRYYHDPDAPESIGSSIISDILEDDDGQLWMSHFPANVGVSVFDAATGTAVNYQHDSADPFSLGENSAKALYKDESGVIWISMESGMLSKYDPAGRPFLSFYHDPENPNSLNVNPTTTVYEDREGTVWVGTYAPDGLHIFNRETLDFERIELDGLSQFGILETSDGTFWFGSSDGRLHQFDRDARRITASYQVSAGLLTTITEDRAEPDILWITTYSDGLVKFQRSTGKVTKYKNRPSDSTSLSHNQAWVSAYQEEERPDELWVGTIAGLNVFNPSSGQVERTYKHSDAPGSISNDTISSIHRSASGEYWIGTFNGLNKFDPQRGTFEQFTLSNGRFPVQVVCGIVEDRQGNLWMSTGDAKIVRFTPDSDTYKTYDANDGVGIGGCFIVPRLQTERGEIWFGGDGGLTMFHPDDIQENTFQPPVYVTALTQGGEEMPLAQAPERVREIALGWQAPFFEFSMAALNYRKPEKNQYRYILEGWDTGWYESGTLPKGRYSGLTGGAYTLKVMGSNNDGVWSDRVAELRVIVEPPFWKTWWFYSLVAGALAALAGYVYVEQITRLKSENRTNILRKELELARQIQTAILPKHIQHPDFEIEAVMLPAEEVGGDYYDVLTGKDGNLWLGIGDVSGHGMTPGLIMMMAQTVHTTITTQTEMTPQDVIVSLNDVLFRNVQGRLDTNHFMTFTTLRYLGEGRFQHAGAHLDLLVHRQAGGRCDRIDTEGAFLNFIPDISHAVKNAEFVLEIGDSLVLYTDGLTEAHKPGGKILDIQRFSEIVERHAAKAPSAMRDAILTDVLAWSEQHRQDDMTLLIVRRTR